MPIQISLTYLMAFFIGAFIFGFGSATALKFPLHILQAGFLKLQGKAPRVFAIISNDGVFNVAIKERAPSYNTKRYKGYKPDGQGLNILGIAPGQIWYEKSILPLDTSPATLDEAITKSAEEMAKEGPEGVSVPLALKVIGTEYLTLFYTTTANTAQRIAEARVKRKSEILIIILMGLVGVNVVLTLYGIMVIQKIPGFLNAILVQIQAGGFGLK